MFPPLQSEAQSNAPLKAILFDLDGTLANTDPLHFQVFQQMLDERGVGLDAIAYGHKISGRTNQAILQDFFPHFSEADIQHFSHEKESRYRALAQTQIEPLPGLLALLDRLQKNQLKTAVVTNAPRLNAEFMLAALGLAETFEFVILGEDLPRAKPDPLPYETAIARFGIQPQEALVFEDSPAGIRAAIAAGIPTVGVASTHEPQALLALGVEFVVQDFMDERLWGDRLFP
jgi:HAD superfamily hydrolase (TIGR01509 family)